MKIATWNVNSVRARQERVLAWLDANAPDVLCLQELKVADDAFDAECFRECGYEWVMHGQKTYNGVGILARTPIEVTARNMDDDPQARLIAARINGVDIVNVYVPNGSEVSSDKWDYKLRWLAAFRQWLTTTYTPTDALIVCGDFNIVPADVDAAHPDRWEGSVLTAPEVRRELAAMLEWGLTDVLQAHHPDGGMFSWWDYRHLAFPKNNGLRLDLILATEPLAAACTTISVDRYERKGSKPSDHAPVVMELSR